MTVFRPLGALVLALVVLLLLLTTPALHAADGALQFTAASQQYVEVPNFHQLGVTNEVTVEFWARATATAAQSVFILFPDSAANRFQATVSHNSGTMTWDFGDTQNGGRATLANPSNTVGNWVHYAFVASQSGGYMRIYVNGLERASVASMNPFETVSASVLRIGGGTGAFYGGALDEFRVWNVERTREQILSSCDRPLTGSEAGLRLYLKFDEGAGTTAVNSATATGAALNGLLTNGPARITGAVLPYTVSNTNNTGAGSLRQAFIDAAAAAGPGLITFAPGLSGQAIALTTSSSSTGIAVTDTGGVTVDASSLPAAVSITDGTSQGYRLFSVAAGARVVFRGVTLSNGGGTSFVGDGGAVSNNGTLGMDGCTVSGNSALGSGGAIFNSSPSFSNAVLSQCAFTGNQAGSDGGAVRNLGTVHMLRCTVSGNSSGASGAGIDSGLSLFISDTTVSGNTAGVSGGGLRGMGITLVRCTITGNTASGTGGGGGLSGSGKLSHCTVQGNRAPGGNGGGLQTTEGILTLTHCTVSGNSAGGSLGGGGVYMAAGRFLTLSGCVVAGNTITGGGAQGADIRNEGTVSTFLGNSIVQAGIYNLPGFGTVGGGSTVSSVNPLLAALADNGGQTQTMALLPGSPAINGAAGSNVTRDQRDFPVVGIPDMGAFENQTPPFFDPIADVTTDQDSATGEIPIATSESGPFNATASVPGLVSSFVFGGGGTSRHLVITPAPGQTGTATITVMAGGLSQAFTLNVRGLNVCVAAGAGPGTLTDALAYAASRPGADTITFAPSFSGQTLELDGPLAGGAIVVRDPAGLTIDATSLPDGLTLGGKAHLGISGRFCLFAVEQDARLTLRGLILTRGGGEFYTAGGAIHNQGILTVDRCTITNCRSSGTYGGGIFNGGLGNLLLIQSTLCNNLGDLGGGAVMNEGCLNAVHCTITGNSVNAFAGFDRTGAGVWNHGTAEFTHCIISGNVRAGTTADDFVIGEDGEVRLTGANIIGTLENEGKLTGTAPITVPPRLHPLGKYGGALPVCPPMPGSIAIDQAEVLVPPLLTDQRGRPRVAGLRPDIGAVEASIIMVTTGVDELNPPGVKGAGFSLREAVRDVEAGGIIAFDPAVFNRPAAGANILVLTLGPLNPPLPCYLDASLNPGGIQIVHRLSFNLGSGSQAVASGAPANFVVAVTQVSGGVAYQWRRNGTALEGQTGPALNIASAQEMHEGAYDVVIAEAPPTFGAFFLNGVTLQPAFAVSAAVTLVVDGGPPVIFEQPAGAMLAVGGEHTLSVTAAVPGAGAAAVTYQWRRNGRNLPGATQRQYRIEKAALKHAGAYSCAVKTGAAQVLVSSLAEIGVVDATPRTVTLAPGGKFTGTVEAAGNGLSYVWSSGALTASFTLASVTPADAGLHTCTVSGLAGVFTGGAPTRLNVSTAPPQILRPLVLPEAMIGQWYHYQIPVVGTPGAEAAIFSVTGLPPGVTCHKDTGVVSGRPTASKPAGYPLVVKVTNQAKGSDSEGTVLRVNALPATTVGVFTGPAGRSPLNGNLGGRLDLTITAAGSFSGSLTLGARARMSFASQLLHSSGPGDVILQGSIPGLALDDKIPLGATLEVFAADQSARLTLLHPSGSLVISAWRNPWSQKTPAADYASYYTVRLDPGTDPAAPQGYGFGSFTVKPDGRTILVGRLSDGSAILSDTLVGWDGQILLFNLLYEKRGSVVGSFRIDFDGAIEDNSLEGSLNWFKPATVKGPADTIYKSGFGPLAVTVGGGAYVPPAKGALVMGLGPVASPGANARLAFTLGGLDVDGLEFDQDVRIASAGGGTNTVVIRPPVVNRVTMPALDAPQGAFIGGFTVPGAGAGPARTGQYFGQIVRIGASTQGYGFFLLPQVPASGQTVTTAPKLSGRVVLGVP